MYLSYVVILNMNQSGMSFLLLEWLLLTHVWIKCLNFIWIIIWITIQHGTKFRFLFVFLHFIYTAYHCFIT